MAKRLVFWTSIGFALLIVSIVISLSVGSAHIPVGDVWRLLLSKVPGFSQWIHNTWTPSDEQIVLVVRAPRVLLAILVGAALAMAGAGFQGVLRNPLAEPYTLGVASGSAAGALAVIMLGFQFVLSGFSLVPLVAFVGGLLTLLFVISLARQQGKMQLETLILAGVVIQAFCGSVVSFMLSMSTHSLNEMMQWLMGNLALKDWSYSLLMSPYILVGFTVLLFYSRELNLFSLGEQQAAHLGVRIERTKIIVMIVCTLLTAAAVSMAGIISFVGLVIPHVLRLLIGPDYRILLPLSGLYGACYVLLADTLSRIVLEPVVIPLGVITSFLGAPFFAYLLIKSKRSGISI